LVGNDLSGNVAGIRSILTNCDVIAVANNVYLPPDEAPLTRRMPLTRLRAGSRWATSSKTLFI
jgi:hypothetical protein